MLTQTRPRPRTRSPQQGPLLRYGFGESPAGPIVVAWSDQGLCALRLAPQGESRALGQLKKDFPGARLELDPEVARPVETAIDDFLAGRPVRDVPLDLRGTPFQIRVWGEMRKIPHGQTVSYRELARRAGRPRAVRAAANACGRNPVGILVPCHRVVASDGSLGGYFWGLDVKRALLREEGVEV